MRIWTHGNFGLETMMSYSTYPLLESWNNE